MNFKNVLQVDKASKWEAFESTNEIEWYKPKGDVMVCFKQKEHCKTINMTTKHQPIKIIIKVDIIWEKLKRKLDFLKRNKITFAWNSTNLKGMPLDIYQHCIILEDGIILIQQC
jgi:hypothetical protein